MIEGVRTLTESVESHRGSISVREYRLLEKAVMDLIRAVEGLANGAGVHRKSTTFYRHWVEHAYNDE